MKPFEVLQRSVKKNKQVFILIQLCEMHGPVGRVNLAREIQHL